MVFAARRQFFEPTTHNRLTFLEREAWRGYDLFQILLPVIIVILSATPGVETNSGVWILVEIYLPFSSTSFPTSAGASVPHPVRVIYHCCRPTSSPFFSHINQRLRCMVTQLKQLGMY
jgi:hypothetical protein